jgi:hypothetical protein
LTFDSKKETQGHLRAHTATIIILNKTVDGVSSCEREKNSHILTLNKTKKDNELKFKVLNRRGDENEKYRPYKAIVPKKQ